MRNAKTVIFFVTVLMVLMSFIYGTENTKKKKSHHDHQKKASKERVYYFERQNVVVEDFKAEGYILDIGGGGEGVIGQLKGRQVIAIDISKRELEEAPPGPLKIIMDGRDLKFLDNTFNTATVFFTFMYINGSHHKKVFQELFRVMKPGGRLLIWDVMFKKLSDPKKEIAVFRLTVKLPHKEINTGYGVPWPKKEQGLAHYIQLAEEVGFNVVTKKDNVHWFYLELKKKEIL